MTGNLYQQKPLSDQVRKPRKCLMCTKDFDSRSPSNRICYRCKQKHDYRYPGLDAEPYTVRR